MKKFIILFLFLLLVFIVSAQGNREAVLQELEENQPSRQDVVSTATMKSASRLFVDKNDLTSVILIVPAGSVVDVLDADSSYFHVLYEENEGFILRRHATLNNVPIMSRPVARQQEPVRESGPVSQSGVSVAEAQSESAQQKVSRQTYLENKYGSDIAARMMAMKVWKGMTGEMVRDSWGKPQKINRVISGNDVKEEWIFKSSWLYIENDYLVDWGPVR